MIMVYSIDLVLRPFIYVLVKLRALICWWRGTPEEVVDVTPHELEWRGPNTATTVDNELYRDRIRARSLENRKPNHLVTAVESEYARHSTWGCCKRKRHPKAP